MSRRRDTLVRVLYFFFSAVFAFCVALYIHEAGHALMIKAVHGYFPKMSMNPLAGGYVSYYAAPATAAQRLAISSGGIVAGIIAGVACAGSGLAVWRSVWAAPVILLGIVSLCVNALMLTAGYFLFATGDIHRMVGHGFPVWLATVLGLAGLAAGGWFLIGALPFFGLDSTSTLTEKYIVLGSGVVFYGVLVLAVAAARADAAELQKKFMYVAATLGVLSVGLVLVDRAVRRFPGTPPSRQPVGARHVIFSAVLAAAAFVMTGM